MHLSQQQVELQSQSFIFNSTRVSGQTNVLLISILLLLKQGMAIRGRELDYREWEQEIERGEEEEGGKENRVQLLNHCFFFSSWGNIIILRLDSLCYLSYLLFSSVK